MIKNVKVEISARHVHVSRKDLDILFGVGHSLKKYKNLSQDGEFASTDVVDLISDSGTIDNVRILGPVRKETQVELSLTDARKLMILAPIRISGDINGTPGIKIKGPVGEVYIPNGVIIAKRHFHCSLNTAQQYGLKNGDNIKVKINGIRGLIFDNVEVRVADSFNDAIHLDTDEGNACSDGSGIIYGDIEIDNK